MTGSGQCRPGIFSVFADKTQPRRIAMPVCRRRLRVQAKRQTPAQTDQIRVSVVLIIHLVKHNMFHRPTG